MGRSHGLEWEDPKKLLRLKELFEKGYSRKKIAEILTQEWGVHVTVDMVAKAKERYEPFDFYIEENIDTVKFYESDTLPMGNYMVGCDDHSPYHSVLYENRFLMIAKLFGIKTRIEVGDLINQDYASHWPKLEGGTNRNIDEEIAQAEPLFKALDYFDEIYLVQGNHESRVTRITEGRIQGKHILKIFGQKIHDKFKYTPYDKIFIGDEFMAVHPKSYSQISASTAVRLAEKYHRHVLNAHGHFIALRYDRSGKYMGIDLGGLFDSRKIDYINLQTTTHPAWNQGFGMIYRGKFWHFHEGTDWDFWDKQFIRIITTQ